MSIEVPSARSGSNGMAWAGVVSTWMVWAWSGEVVKIASARKERNVREISWMRVERIEMRASVGAGRRIVSVCGHRNRVSLEASDRRHANSSCTADLHYDEGLVVAGF